MLRSPQHLRLACSFPSGILRRASLNRSTTSDILLVLDSCEHVIEAVSRLAEQIHQHASGVALLATSRESLDAEGESVFEVASLGIPPDNFGSEAELGRYSSTRLFMECAVAAGYSAVVTDADVEVVGRICRKLDGMPLAIELVASRLSAHGLVEIDELIGGRLRLAWRGRRTAPLRHQSLSAALDWSYELIAPAERTLLEYLTFSRSVYAAGRPRPRGPC